MRENNIGFGFKLMNFVYTLFSTFDTPVLSYDQTSFAS